MIAADRRLYNRAMAETDSVGATRERFEEMFEAIAAAMKIAAEKEDRGIASSEAVRFGMTEVPPRKPIGTAWEIAEGGLKLWFQWRYYDPSHAFSVQKDINILSLELREGDKVIRE